MSNRGITNTPR